MKKPLEYLSEEALEQIRACGPQTDKECVRFWLEAGFPEGDRLEDHYPVELIAEVKQEMDLHEEYRQSFKRCFQGQNLETAHVHFDGHTARNEFLRDGWNYAINQGWLRTEEVELEQETFIKGFLTDKGRYEVLGVFS